MLKKLSNKLSNQIGIIDEPVSPGNDDKLDINVIQGLTHSWKTTPITIFRGMGKWKDIT